MYAPVSKKNDFSYLSFELYNLEIEIRTRKNKKDGIKKYNLQVSWETLVTFGGNLG